MTTYEAPTFVEIAMNAEIGNYQDELERPGDELPFADQGPTEIAGSPTSG